VSEVKKYIAEYIEQYVNYNYIRKYRKMIGIGWILIWISLALTIISMIDYVAKNIQVLKN